MLALLCAADAFYLPGVSPHEYMDGERVDVKVNKLSSATTQLPYDYYNLAFCQPRELKYSAENLGEVLHGSMIQNSPYELFARRSDFRILCKMDLDRIQAANFARRIREDYRVHMIMDNLPAATRMISELPDGKTVTMYDRGYRLGFLGAKEFPGTEPKVPYLNNHLRFIIKYHNDDAFVGARIVGFEVEAFSVKHTYKGTWDKDAKLTSVPLSPDLPPQPVRGAGEYIFTYDVTWEASPIRWASRWDLYLYMGDDQIHWFSILNSLAIVLLLTGIVAMIMMRTLRRDLSRCACATEPRAAAALARVRMPLQVQLGGEGGAAGGVGLEARARRRAAASAVPAAAVGECGHGDAAARHDAHLDRLCDQRASNSRTRLLPRAPGLLAGASRLAAGSASA